MKIHFDVGEHVICTLETKQLGVHVGLDGLPTIAIYDPDDTVIAGIDGVTMTESDTGTFQYDFYTVGKVAGTYRVKTVAVHSARITITNGAFKLV